MTKPLITAFDWVPPPARGQVRDLRVRWALEEVGQPYDVDYLSQGEQKQPPYRERQPFGQVPTYQKVRSPYLNQARSCFTSPSASGPFAGLAGSASTSDRVDVRRA